jgi:acetylornithine deacetylase
VSPPRWSRRTRHRRGLAGDVVVAAVADEEHASIGVQETLAAIGADAAIVTEPTELEVAIAHKGFVWCEIEITGRPRTGRDRTWASTRSPRRGRC